MEPFPNCRSICETAASIALLLSNASSKKGPCIDKKVRLLNDYTGGIHQT
jgi:hypothetical protein